MIKKEELQSFYNEYQEKIDDLYYQYIENGEQEERQKLHREIEGMIYVLDSLRERFDLAPLGTPKNEQQNDFRKSIGDCRLIHRLRK